MKGPNVMLGYLKAEGLEVRMSDFAGGSRSLQAVIGGGADVVAGAYEHTITLQAKGQQYQEFEKKKAAGYSAERSPA